MAKYTPIHRRMWLDKRFRALSDDGKLTFVLCLSHPQQTAIGAFHGAVPGLACDLGWPQARMQSAMDELARAGMVAVDPEACLIAVPRYLKHNAPANPSLVRSWKHAFEELPECALLMAQIARAYQCVMSRGQAFVDAFPADYVPVAAPCPTSCPTPCPTPCPTSSGHGVGHNEHEHDPENEHDPEDSCEPPAKEPDADGAEIVIELPCKGGAVFGVSRADADAFAEAHPSLNVILELRKMRLWLAANPGKLKTAKGTPRFIGNWLNRAGDRPSQQAKGQTVPPFPGEREFTAEEVADILAHPTKGVSAHA